MRLNPLVKALSRGTFLISERAFATYMPLAHEWYKSISAEEKSEEIGLNPDSLPYAVSRTGNNTVFHKGADENTVFESIPSGSVAIIPIKGVIMKEDFCGTPGTATIANWVKQANNNPNIIGIVYDVDTGGGAVDGTGEAADVFELVKADKPTVTYNNGLMASAGYWLGCAGGREIYMSHQTAEAGSIGTMVTVRDWRKAMEMYGIVDTHIMADASHDKWATFLSAIDGDTKPMKTEILNPTNDVFLLAVKRNREGKLVFAKEEPLTGKVYVGLNAQAIGLVDGFKTLDECIDRVIEMDTQSQSSKTSNTNTDMKIMILAAWTALRSFLKLDAKDGEDVETTLAKEQLEQINAELAKVGQLTTDLNAALEANKVSEAAKLKAEQDLAAEKAAHQTLKTEFDAAKARMPGANTTVKEGKEDTLDDNKGEESALDKHVREMRSGLGINNAK